MQASQPMIESTSVGASTEFSSTEFDALLERYLHTSLHASLTEVRQQATLVPDEMRLRAWHLLSYALRTGKAWPETRDLLTTLAPKMEQAGFREEWIAYLVAGVEVATQHNDRATIAEFALQIATLWRMLSEYEQAVQWLDNSLAGFRQEQDRRGEARALNELAWIEQLRRRYDDASQHVEQALALLDEDDPERGMCYRVQGMIAIYRGEWEQAEVHHRAALVIFEKHGDMRKAAWSLVNHGIALRGQKKYDEAIGKFTEAIKTLKKLNDDQSLSVAQLNLGLTYHFVGKNDEALSCLLNAESVALRLHDQTRLADIYLNLGLTYLAQRVIESAKKSFQSSIQLFDTLGIKNMMVNSMDGLAMSYLAENQYDQAAKILDRAIGILPEIIHAPHYEYYKQSLNKHRQQAEAGLALLTVQSIDIV